ncbi:MAG: hypothetical protein RMJ43_15855 [Chloroherpetonaceae bacterium]|nr:hypothetical protein [Chthonomonadaceae bacterium]MDW8209309.1 hypothetical protein [Chloroherpetonaceae bacterium]
MTGKDRYGEYPREEGREYTEDFDLSTLYNDVLEMQGRFERWIRCLPGVDAHAAQRMCYNTEFFLDYLVNQFEKPVQQINEFELRWFLFSDYIRNARVDEDTALTVLDSLRYFFDFLSESESWSRPQFVDEVLSERAYYLERRRKYLLLDAENVLVWHTGYRRWCEELEDYLDARCLWLPRDMGKGMEWGEEAGWREGTLRREAHRRWLEEREALLQEGWDFETVRTRLFDSLMVWLDTPQRRLGNATPREVIAQERSECADAVVSNGY